MVKSCCIAGLLNEPAPMVMQLQGVVFMIADPKPKQHLGNLDSYCPIMKSNPNGPINVTKTLARQNVANFRAMAGFKSFEDFFGQ